MLALSSGRGKLFFHNIYIQHFLQLKPSCIFLETRRLLWAIEDDTI